MLPCRAAMLCCAAMLALPLLQWQQEWSAPAPHPACQPVLDSADRPSPLAHQLLLLLLLLPIQLPSPPPTSLSLQAAPLDNAITPAPSHTPPCLQPYVSEFGSLLPRTAGSMQHLNRILLTHAPYMTKLESLASSATRYALRCADPCWQLRCSCTHVEHKATISAGPRSLTRCSLVKLRTAPDPRFLHEYTTNPCVL